MLGVHTPLALEGDRHRQLRQHGCLLALTLPLLPQGGSRDDTEQRYSSQYEERLDPFSSFSRKV